MAWVGAVDGAYWAADFRVARLIHHVYVHCGRPRPVLVIGLSGAEDEPGQVGPTVARELARTHRGVFGHPDQPVAVGQAGGVLLHIAEEFPGAFVVMVQGAPSEAARDGHVLLWSPAPQAAQDEVVEELREALAAGQLPPPPPLAESGHVHVVGLVGGRPASLAERRRRLERTCDVIIDGILRFFYRIGQLS